MCTSGLPNIYTLSPCADPQASGVYIRQTTHAHGITIIYIYIYIYKISRDLENGDVLGRWVMHVD